jgi:hypothetical protein
MKGRSEKGSARSGKGSEGGIVGDGSDSEETAGGEREGEEKWRGQKRGE